MEEWMEWEAVTICLECDCETCTDYYGCSCDDQEYEEWSPQVGHFVCPTETSRCNSREQLDGDICYRADVYPLFNDSTCVDAEATGTVGCEWC